MNCSEIPGSITKNQLEYIKILSSYESSKDKDAKIIEEFLNDIGRERLEDLSRHEAHLLITKLLEIPVEYQFPCGKKKLIRKDDYNRYSILCYLEACLHECEIDVHECNYWSRKSKATKK
ncbi:MAG: hypothetical protein QXS29_06030 [Nitrososphaeria archaeon]